MVRATRALALATRSLEKAAADCDLTFPQYRVLALIATGDERSSLLANRLAVARPTITAVVDGLVERGLVCREAVAGDRRSIRVALTADGRGALRAAEIQMTDVLGRLWDAAEDPGRLTAALCDLDDALRRAVAGPLARGWRVKLLAPRREARLGSPAHRLHEAAQEERVHRVRRGGIGGQLIQSLLPVGAEGRDRRRDHAQHNRPARAVADAHDRDGCR